jgi:TonB family protein
MIAPLLFLLAQAPGLQPLPDHPPARYLSAADAAAAHGRVTVCGIVRTIEYPATKKDPTLFDLDAPAGASVLAVVMRPGDLGRFPQMFDQLLTGRQLCLTGTVDSIDGRKEMRLTQVGQVEFIGQPPPAPEFGISTGALAGKTPGIVHPVPVSQVEPRYTSDAMRAKIQGSVMIGVVVGADGKVRDMRLETSLDPIYGLDMEALRAAAGWTFRPAMKDGQPVASVAKIVLTFHLH